MNRKEDILDAWIMVEHLSEGDINLREQSVKLLENLENGDFYSLFLLHIEKKKFEEFQNGGVVMYFDILKFVLKYGNFNGLKLCGKSLTLNFFRNCFNL